MAASARPRAALTREDWIEGAIAALRAGGIDAVRVDSIAQRLGITRGSFYWHFQDRGDLLEAVLQDWEAETPGIVARARAAASPRERLLSFFSLAEASPHPPDAAIFEWARRDRAVSRRVEAVESQRVLFFTEQMRALGMSAREAARFGELLYVATLGWLERRARSTFRGASFGAFGRDVSALLVALLPRLEGAREPTGPRRRR